LAENKRILFLYTELAEYVVSCIRKAATTEGLEIKVVHWRVNKEAPFNFDFPSNVEFIQKDSISRLQLLELVKNFNPHTIISSGWIDKDYMKICSLYFHKCTTVLALDNHWTGSLKQRLLSLVSPFFLKKMFKKAWVPGELQAAYARRLGYDEVAYNFYAPDISYFTSFANKTTVPHRFIFIGRYLTHKGIFDLWEAFIDIKKQHENDWELWCLGTGDKFNERIEHPSIKHFGFIQPNELDEYLKNTGVYVLPSHFEPWGVAVHEMAAAGFPLLLSDAVGSHCTFLKNDNGFLFASTYKDSLKEAMLKVIKTSDEELLKMGNRSVVYANQITQDIWVNTLLKF